MQLQASVGTTSHKSINRTPLVLAIALALGSSTLQAQVGQTPVIPSTSITNTATQLVATNGGELVIIDGAVDDIATLQQAVAPGTEWIVLDRKRDGMVQLSEILVNRSNLSALHILSHGDDGKLLLGNSELNSNNLSAYSKELEVLAAAMAPGADLLLYGCDVAATQKGEIFLKSLQSKTGLDVAASSDITRDGDWELEIAQGVIETPVLRPEGYSASLVAGGTPTGGSVFTGDGSGGGASSGFFGAGYGYGYGYGGNGGNGGGDNDTLTGSAGNDILFGDGSGGGAGGSFTGGYYYAVQDGGRGGSGNDNLNGGSGDDILFGDGFDGESTNGYGYSKYGSNGGFGGGGGGGGKYYYSGGKGGMFAGAGGDKYGSLDGQPGTGSQGGTGDSTYVAFGKYGKYIENAGGGGGWSDGSGAGAGANAPSGKYTYVVAGVAGSTTPLSIADTTGNRWFDVMNQVGNGYFALPGALDGGAGDDTLDGGSGSDHLFGMGGSDTFQVHLTDAPAGDGDVDTIHDFVQGDDVIELYNSQDALISDLTRADLLINQQTSGSDRSLTYTVAGDSITVVVKGINNDLTVDDLPATTNLLPFFAVIPTIVGNGKAGEELSLENTTASDADGLVVAYSYQWRLNGAPITGATDPAYTLLNGDIGGSVDCIVTAIDDKGAATAQPTDNAVTVVNTVPTFTSDPVILGGDTILGGSKAGEVLSLNMAVVDGDADVLNFSYQWRLNGAPIAAATNSTYRLLNADIGNSVDCVVTVSDGHVGGNVQKITEAVGVGDLSLYDEYVIDLISEYGKSGGEGTAGGAMGPMTWLLGMFVAGIRLFRKGRNK